MTPSTPTTFEARRVERPFFSVCVPQYSRFPFLLRALEVLAAQTLRSFEVCISDDRSPEARHSEVVAFLDAHGLSYTYLVQRENLRYDANLRAAMGCARGEYCLLMGNDDALAGPTVLADLHDAIQAAGLPGVVITDFADATTREPARRIHQTADYGAGPAVAAAHFRNFSFVSGVLLRREPAQACATAEWDGSEMYQTFVGCRLIASGLRLLEIATPLVVKDVRVPGEAVDSYARRPRDHQWAVQRLPLRLLGQVAFCGVAPFTADEDERQRVLRLILRQLVLLTYPYWLFEYRRVQSWRYAAGVAAGMRPGTLLGDARASLGTRLYVHAAYAAATGGGLLLPQRLFRSAQQRLYRLAKRPIAKAAAGEAALSGQVTP